MKTYPGLLDALFSTFVFVGDALGKALARLCWAKNRSAVVVERFRIRG